MDTSNINMKDHHRITKSTRDHCSNNNMMMIKSQTTNNTNTINLNIPKEYSRNYIYNNNNNININQTSFDNQDQEDFMINAAFSWPPRSYTCSFCKREFRSAQALGGHMNVHRKDRARLRHSPPRDNIGQYGLYGNSTNSSTPSTFINLNHNPNPNPNFSPSNLNVSTASPLCSLTSKPPLSSLLPSPYSAHGNNDHTESKKWPWNSAIPVGYGSTTYDDHHTELHHHDHDEYSLINIKGGTDRKMSVCGVGSEELRKGLAGKDHQVYSCKGLKTKMTETTMARPTSVRLDLEIGLFRDHESEIGQDLDLELRLGYSN